MGNMTSPPCVCCETQIGGGGYGFLPHHSLPPAAIKVASLISPSISSFFGLTHLVPLFLICDGVGGLGCSIVQNMFELWLKFDCRIWWWWIWQWWCWRLFGFGAGGYWLVWRIVVVFIGFDGLGFDFCGRTQHPFFI